MFVNYYTVRTGLWFDSGRWSCELCDILIFRLTDCVWMVPGTFEP